MTDEQYEVAARKYCELAGLDPNEIVDAPSRRSPDGHSLLAVQVWEQRWNSVVRRIKADKASLVDAARMTEAIEFALKDRRKPSVPNAETERAIRDAEAGINVTRYSSIEEMFEDLGIDDGKEEETKDA